MFDFFVSPSLQSALHSLPVNYIPDSTKILSLSVLVLKIVRMLPSINTQQWSVLAYDWILVCICSNLDLTSLVVLDQPRPSTSLDTCQSRVEFCLEG